VPQLVTRIDDETAAAIDALVDDGEFASRSDVVRAGILRLVDERRRRAIGDEIIAGYERVPETAEELAASRGERPSDDRRRAVVNPGHARATSGGRKPRTSVGRC
jgi:Arc/MetJ-type ribon-helix-helix transcriptional regulator